MAGDLVIVATPPAAQITQIGTDHAPGVWAEDVSWDHSLPDHGARQCQFTLRREPAQEWPDLQPFTPLQLIKGGSVVWTGRVQQTPTIRGRENQITVIGEGWPAHLKDDALERMFVHDDLTEWRDARSWKSTSLATFSNAFNVETGSGAIVMSVALGNTAATGTSGGAQIDLGPYSTCKRLVITYKGGGIAGLSLFWNAGDADTAADESGTVDATPIATASTTFAVTLATARRYVRITLGNASGAPVAGLDTGWVTLERVICFADTAYESGNASILKASQVIPVVLAYAPKVSQSTLGITTTSFVIPHYDGPVSNPGDYIDAVNAYHSFQWFLRDGADGGSPTMQFRAIPSSPTLVANVGNGIEFNDASRNDGSDIYNRVIVEYQDAAGNTAREERTTSGLSAAFADPDITFDTTSTIAAGPNPGFETAGGPPPSGWQAFIGTLTRDVVIFDTGVASGLAASDGAGTFSIGTLTTGLTPGRTYQVSYRVRNNAAWLAGTITAKAAAQSGADPPGTTDSFTNAIGAAFTTRSYTFTAPASGAVSLAWNTSTSTAAANLIYIDNVKLFEARPTIVDRQNFVRTRVLSTGSRLTAAAAQQIGDIFLQAHRFTPLRGSLTITGAAIRTLTGDVPIPAHLVGSRYLGDAILINETHPDLGSIGRVGIINAASYNEADDTVQVSIDTNRDFIDSLLSRLSIFS